MRLRQSVRAAKAAAIRRMGAFMLYALAYAPDGSVTLSLYGRRELRLQPAQARRLATGLASRGVPPVPGVQSPFTEVEDAAIVMVARCFGCGSDELLCFITYLYEQVHGKKMPDASAGDLAFAADHDHAR